MTESRQMPYALEIRLGTIHKRYVEFAAVRENVSRAQVVRTLLDQALDSETPAQVGDTDDEPAELRAPGIPLRHLLAMVTDEGVAQLALDADREPDES